jgi:hypothetical protein
MFSALKTIVLVLIATGLAVEGLSFAIFNLPWVVLEQLSEAKRDLLISSGAISPKVHPLYRDWLYGFVSAPNAPRGKDHIMDTYAAYGEIIHTSLDEDATSDFMGWPNTISPHEADVLFAGDSFASGASAGTRLSPPALYAKLTGAKVYKATQGGYGIGQYVRSIDMLTGGLPEGQRFTGKDVVVMVYMGNDFTGDIFVDIQRHQYTENSLAWQMKLGPLRAWVDCLLTGFGIEPSSAAFFKKYSPAPLTCRTPGELPFAWHPGNSAFLKKENFAMCLPFIQELISQMKGLEARGLTIKIVLVPTSMQVVYGDIDWSKIPAGSDIAEDIPRIVQGIEEIRAAGKALFVNAGFEVLDVTDILRDSPDHCLYYQPADTHCTALGYEAIAQAIASRWPHLGR